MVIITCEKEMGGWTIRVNGIFVADFWREKVARRIAMRLADALNKWGAWTKTAT